MIPIALSAADCLSYTLIKIHYTSAETSPNSSAPAASFPAFKPGTLIPQPYPRIQSPYSPTLTWHYPQQPEAFNNPTLYSLSAEKSFHPILTCRLPSGLRPATAILLRILILYRKIDEETTSFLLFFAPFSFFTIEDLAVVGYETHGTGEGYSCGSVTQRSHQVYRAFVRKSLYWLPSTSNHMLTSLCRVYYNWHMQWGIQLVLAEA